VCSEDQTTESADPETGKATTQIYMELVDRVNANYRRMADEFYANHILQQYAIILKAAEIRRMN
jgi:hypothetical protein